MRLTPQPGMVAEVEAALRSSVLPRADDVQIERGRAPGRVHDREYVQAAVSLRALLQDTSDATVTKMRLAEYVAAVFRVAS